MATFSVPTALCDVKGVDYTSKTSDDVRVIKRPYESANYRRQPFQNFTSNTTNAVLNIQLTEGNCLDRKIYMSADVLFTVTAVTTNVSDAVANSNFSVLAVGEYALRSFPINRLLTSASCSIGPASDAVTNPAIYLPAVQRCYNSPYQSSL